MFRLRYFVFSAVLFAASSVVGQQNVVVIDMGKVFQEHLRFKQSVEVLQQQVEAFKSTIQQDRARVQTESEALAGINRSTPEYKAKEAAIAKMAADMQVNHNMKNREFMEQEAKLYYQTYVEVLSTVQNFCRQNNVPLVIRFTSNEIDSTNRASVLAGVNNVVVYQDRRDITNAIIAAVNQGATNQANQRQTGSVPLNR